jgi:hypothetical protein
MLYQPPAAFSVEVGLGQLLHTIEDVRVKEVPVSTGL